MLLQKIFRIVLPMSLLLVLSPATHAQSDGCRLAWGINLTALRQMEQPELSLKLPPHLPKGAYWLRIRQHHQTHSLLLVK